MVVQSKLYTATKNRRCEVLGTASQVYDVVDYSAFVVKTIEADNVAVLLGIDNNAHWMGIYAPQVHKDLQGNPFEIVGNISDTQGDFSLVKIPVAKLRFFPIFGPKTLLPVAPEVSSALTADHLKGTPHEGQNDIFVSSLPSWIIIYNGMAAPEGDVRSDESESIMSTLGCGYRNWHKYAVQYTSTSQSDDVLRIIDDIKMVDEMATYVQPENSKRPFSQDGPMTCLFRAPMKEYPEVIRVLGPFFAPAATASPGLAVSGLVQGAGPAIVIKDARDAEKETMAAIGQSKIALYNVGAKLDVVGGKVTNVTYPTFSRQLTDVLALPRASRAPQLSSLFILTHRTAKKSDPNSIFSIMSSMETLPRNTAVNYLVGNWSHVTLTSMHGDVTALDVMFYAPQMDRALVNQVQMAEARSQNDTNCDVVGQRGATPTTGVQRVGVIQNFKGFKRMCVNCINTTAMAVDNDVMTAAGAPHLVNSIARFFSTILWDRLLTRG